MTFGPYVNALPGNQGLVPGVLQVGIIRDISQAALAGGELTIWSHNTLYPWDWTPAQISFVSSSADDTAAGPGAKSLLIEGLDESLEQISETLPLAGLTPVLTALTYARINKVRCVSGTSGTNAGNITGTSGLDVVAYIASAQGNSLQAVFTVPANWAAGACLHRFFFNKSSKVPGTAVSSLYYRLPGIGTWELVGGFASKDAVSDYIAQSLIQLPAGTDLHATLTDLDANSVRIVSSFELTEIPVYP